MYATNDVDGLLSIHDGPPLRSTIVVATDGTHDSDEAVRIGVELSRHHGVDVQLISVVELSDFAEYEGSTQADIARATRLAIVSREGELTAQRQRARIAACASPHSIHVGCRVKEIVEFAEQHCASLIVMGVGSRGVLTRLLQRHTVMRVAATTTIPILAVPTDGLPPGDSRMWMVASPTHH